MVCLVRYPQPDLPHHVKVYLAPLPSPITPY